MSTLFTFYERYEREHDYQLRLYDGAKSWLKNSGIDPTTLKIKDIEEHIKKIETDRQTLTSSYKAKELEHSKLKSMEESIMKFRESSGRSTIAFRRKTQDKNL